MNNSVVQQTDTAYLEAEASLLGTISSLVLTAYSLIGVAALVYGYFWNRSKYFARKGIPTPPLSSVFSGNLRDLQDRTEPHTVNLQKWTKQYGELFGYFEGGLRVIFTSKLDIIRDVYVNKFEKFHGRKPINPFPFNPDTDVRASVFISRGIRWKRLRSLFEPSFNMKMTKLHQTVFKDSNKHMVEYMEKNVDIPMDFHKLTLEWVADIVERLCLGKSTSTIGAGVNKVANLVDLFFHPPSYWEHKLLRLYVSTHEFTNYTQYMHKFIRLFSKNYIYKLEDQISDLVKEKRKNRKPGDKPNDILDIFVDAQASDDEVQELKEINKATDAQFKTKISKQLTEEEILAMSTMTILAAVETTHSTLKTFFHSMASNPESQKKLQEEIDRYIADRQDINLDNVGQMPYLDWCLKESQRLHPVAYPAISRECMETTAVGDEGLVMDKGTFVYANYYDLHRNPKYWGEDADKFIPERWDPHADRLPSQLDLVYAPFGHPSAPRTCPGKVFAIAEIKLATVEVFRKFSVKFDAAHSDQNEAGILVYSMPNLTLRLEKRESVETEAAPEAEAVPMYDDIKLMKAHVHNDINNNDTLHIADNTPRQRVRCG